MRDNVLKIITEKFKDDIDIYLLLGDLGVFQARFAHEFDSYRCINYGIMEQSMLGFASGISKAGSYPIVYSIAPFIVERSFEQLKLDFGYNKSKGLIITAGGSFDYNKLGPTHYCPNDVSLISTTNCSYIYLPWNSSDANESIKQVLIEKNYTYFRLSSENIEGKDKPPDLLINYEKDDKNNISIGLGPDSVFLAEFLGLKLDYSLQSITPKSISFLSDLISNGKNLTILAGFNIDFLPGNIKSCNIISSNDSKKTTLTIHYSSESQYDTAESKQKHLTSSIKSLDILI